MGNVESKQGAPGGEGGASEAGGGGADAAAPAAAPAKQKKGIDVVFVDDDPLEVAKSVGFSPSMFINGEFKTLKKFCNARKLHQRHLNQLFNRCVCVLVHMSCNMVVMRICNGLQ